MYGIRLDKKYGLTIIDFGGSWIEDDPGCTRAIGNEYFSSPRQLDVFGGKNTCLLDYNNPIDEKPSKADDLISLGYTAVYLAKNCSMSWDPEYHEYSNKNTPETCEKWRSVKAGASLEYLCSRLPATFHTFLQSVFSLASQNTPDYQLYVKMFMSMFEPEQEPHLLII